MQLGPNLRGFSVEFGTFEEATVKTLEKTTVADGKKHTAIEETSSKSSGYRFSVKKYGKQFRSGFSWWDVAKVTIVVIKILYVLALKQLMAPVVA